jgi:hypothetical protein
VEGSSGLNLAIFWPLPGETENNYKQPHLEQAVPHQALNHTPPEYKSETLQLEPTCSVGTTLISCWMFAHLYLWFT